MTAVRCVQPGCHRTTRHSSARCHDHRSATSGRSASTPVAPPRVRAAAPVTFTNDDGSTGEKWYENGALHRTDGPAVILRTPDGWVRREAYYRQGNRHRLDGPAETAYRRDGVPSAEDWWVDGVNTRADDGPNRRDYHRDGWLYSETYLRDFAEHRVDGPARRYYRADGGIDQDDYHFEGERIDREKFAPFLGTLSDEQLTEEFEASSYAPLLAEGRTARQIVTALGEDVWSVEGIRAVCEGAPGEWARSFELGQT